MRFLARLVVLGFAGLGVYKAWELLAPKVSDARQRAGEAREKIEPAIREAADTLHAASKDAADVMTEASSDAASDYADRSARSASLGTAENVSALPKMAT